MLGLEAEATRRAVEVDKLSHFVPRVLCDRWMLLVTEEELDLLAALLNVQLARLFVLLGLHQKQDLVVALSWLGGGGGL